MIVKEYAEAEKNGIVSRKSNARNITPEDYAERLFLDGIAKGWLP